MSALHLLALPVLLLALLLVLYAVGIQYQRGGLWRIVIPVAVVGWLLDVALNYTLLALLTWDFPRAGEHTFSQRLARLITRTDTLGVLARHMARLLNLLAPQVHIQGVDPWVRIRATAPINRSAADVLIESRLLGAVLAYELGKGMFTGGLWVMSTESVTGRVARLATYPQVLSVVWIALSVLAVPYLAMQLFNRFEQFRETFTRLACRAILASGVIWCYLGYLSKNLDYDYVTVIFIFNGLTCVGAAAILANSINSSQRRAQEGAP